MRWLDGIVDSMDVSLSKFWEAVGGQGSLVCCSSWGHKELDMTERLNNNYMPETFLSDVVKTINKILSLILRNS